VDTEILARSTPLGTFDQAYTGFLETIAHLRPRLHRYCAGMTGSVLDGEDVVQDALFEAYRKLGTFDADRPLEPWLFRIAHNRCIDLLRHRKVRVDAEAAAVTPDVVRPDDPPGLVLGQAVEHLVLALPPKERACVLLKDVLDYALEDIAKLVGSTTGGVKAALNRGRSKVRALPARPTPRGAGKGEVSPLVRLYVERFNQRDWEGLRDLIADDAHLRVADRFTGRLTQSPYFGQYERLTIPWHLTIGMVDGEAVIIALRRDPEGWTPHSVVSLEVSDDGIVRVRDYWHCPWVLGAATSVVVEP
jgi:RNA polymerase sigma-70 factor, ECF subfamily